MANKGEQSEPTDLIKYLKANLLLQLRSAVVEGPEQEKPEILLLRAGFTYAEIAELLGKKYDAVAQTINRARKDDEGA